MIFAPPMWRKAGRGRRSRLCFIVRLPPQRLLQPVAIINIGGVANLSFIAPGKEPIACDTGPGNGLL